MHTSIATKCQFTYLEKTASSKGTLPTTAQAYLLLTKKTRGTRNQIPAVQMKREGSLASTRLSHTLTHILIFWKMNADILWHL